MAAATTSRGGTSAKQIGSRFRDARKRLKLTQVQLGEKLEIDQTNISRFENGERGLETEVLLALLTFMAERGVSVDGYILRGDGEIMRPRSESEVLERLGTIERKLETIADKTGEHPVPHAAAQRRR